MTIDDVYKKRVEALRSGGRPPTDILVTPEEKEQLLREYFALPAFTRFGIGEEPRACPFRLFNIAIVTEAELRKF